MVRNLYPEFVAAASLTAVGRLCDSDSIDIPLVFHRVSTIFNRFASISIDFLSIVIDFHVIFTDFREAQKRGIRRPRKIRMAYNNLEGTWRDFAPKKGHRFVLISNRKSTQKVYFFVKSRSGRKTYPETTQHRNCYPQTTPKYRFPRQVSPVDRVMLATKILNQNHRFGAKIDDFWHPNPDTKPSVS